ncbi:MAG: hypothetical protein DSZ33_03045 [Gammaproteobacteria bacterium]|nr:MAG: hypothetical protein DSZ33_03045 [Gammaproteobacteria bacterium]
MKPLTIKHVILLLLPALLVGCASMNARYELNQPLEPGAKKTAEAAEKLPQRSDKTLFLMSFSGGGTRAAALSYGVLQELKNTHARIGRNRSERRLLDEIDYISSVSGGSFTAAYYGLFGDAIFDDFEKVFLRKDIEHGLTSWLISVDMVKRLLSPLYGRSDGVADYYHRFVFRKKNLDELIDRNGPYVEINAADFGRGARFGFSAARLNLICTDPESITVARAVAASSAVPVIFSPITLRNYADQCPHTVPEWVIEALKQKHSNGRRYREAVTFMSYMNPGQRRYIHLLDGGLVDNLGVRASIARSIRAGSLEHSLNVRGKNSTDRIIFIVVDAATKSAAKWDRFPGEPPTDVVVSNATSMPLEQINFETLELLRSQMQEWKDLKENRDFHIIYLSFDQLEKAEREAMQEIPTSFSLEQDQVDKLIEVGGRLLRNNPEYQRWLKDVQ